MAWEIKNVEKFEAYIYRDNPMFPNGVRIDARFQGELWIDGVFDGLVDVWENGEYGGSYDFEKLGPEEEQKVINHMRQYWD